MNFEQLADFVGRRMRMSHIYQPVMLMTLLKHRGACSEREIAQAILSHDESQTEYYQKITRDMVGRVLRSHGIVTRDGQTYRLKDYDDLAAEQVETLVALCQAKLDTYIAQRGAQIWSHRKQSAGYISGSLRYDVLKRAKFHCELCGISADERALEVDHIVPRAHGGTDDPSNLQALCYSCNAMKRDRDDTDFRAVRAAYAHREADCVFCTIPQERWVAENELAYALRDAYPVSDMHTLVIPKRHTPSYFELGSPERSACQLLLEQIRQDIGQQDSTVAGFNVGINDGDAAGQTVFHCHVHLIPRRVGDTEVPRGGVRGVIPGKAPY